MERQIQANIAARGWLESSYYLLGSDYRGGGNTDYLLSYMTQMGGWSIVDYALYYSDDPTTYLRLGYASFLASWALINSGPHESNYGFWYPGAGCGGCCWGKCLLRCCSWAMYGLCCWIGWAQVRPSPQTGLLLLSWPC